MILLYCYSVQCTYIYEMFLAFVFIVGHISNSTTIGSVLRQRNQPICSRNSIRISVMFSYNIPRAEHTLCEFYVYKLHKCYTMWVSNVWCFYLFTTVSKEQRRETKTQQSQHRVKREIATVQCMGSELISHQHYYIRNEESIITNQ